MQALDVAKEWTREYEVLQFQLDASDVRIRNLRYGLSWRAPKLRMLENRFPLVYFSSAL